MDRGSRVRTPAADRRRVRCGAGLGRIRCFAEPAIAPRAKTRPPGSGHLDIAGFVGMGSSRHSSIDLTDGNQSLEIIRGPTKFSCDASICVASPQSEESPVPQQPAGHLNQPKIVAILLLPTDQDAAALRQPRERTLHHPTPRLVTPRPVAPFLSSPIRRIAHRGRVARPRSPRSSRFTTPRGPPSPSTTRLFLVPFLPRSVGFLRLFPPRTGPCPASRPPIATPTSPRRSRRIPTNSARIFSKMLAGTSWTVLLGPNRYLVPLGSGR